MKYIEFCNNVKDTLCGMVDDRCSVRVEEVVKNNQVSLQAVVIMENGKNSAPSIFLEPYYDEYLKGRNLNDICLDIMVINEKYKDAITFDINDFLSYEKIKEKLYVKVINFKKNSKRLEKMPWIKFLDLALVAYVEIDGLGFGSGTVNVTDSNMKMWKINKETLFSEAMKNTGRKMYPCLEKLDEMMRDILNEKIENSPIVDGCDMEQAMEMFNTESDSALYVLTNHTKLNGAVYIVFNDILKSVSDKLNDNFYILPSSIHELIIVPEKCGVPKDELECMVREINRTEVDPKEILSDSVYYFDRKNDDIQIK